MLSKLFFYFDTRCLKLPTSWVRIYRQDWSSLRGMHKALNVAEKPSVAKEITNLLSRGSSQKSNSFSKYNPVYSFPYVVRGENVEMIFTSVSGHMMSLDFPEEYRNWTSCDPLVLFNAPVNKRISENVLDIEKNLKKQILGCKYLLLWLDCDREGENIAFEVIDVCRRVNPSLQIFRARFSAVITREIYRAMETLSTPNMNDSLAVDARSEIDLRIGAVFTRFQSLRLQSKFEGLSDGVISYGPCQFPTLGFVVDRYWKIVNFICEDFWSIEVKFKRDDCIADFHWQRNRLFDKVSSIALYEMCVQKPTATVISIVSQPKRKYRPLPLTTVELQKHASKKLRLSSEQVMQLSEKLYQNGYISYPRTETDSFPDGTDFVSLIQIQTQASQWGQYAQMLLEENEKFELPRKGKNNDQSHPPIHPTKHATNLSSQEQLLYEFIVRHFLACCSKDALGQETTVSIAINDEIFTTKGLMIEQLNWLNVYPYEKWTDRIIPLFHLHETFLPTSMKLHEGKTSPPLLLSESELIQLMDENGIGTDATIAQHIQTIQDRSYVKKLMPEARFQPTNLGLALVEAYNSMGLNLSKPQLRAEMEANMLCISKGTKSKDSVVRDSINKYREIFMSVIRQATLLDQAVSKYFGRIGTTFSKEIKRFSECGQCHGFMNFRSSALESERVLHCEQCSLNLNLPKSGQLSAHQHRCPLCNFQVISVKREENKSYTFCPYCRNNPPLNQLSAETSAVTSFHCFQCNLMECPLAKKTESVESIRPCPQCKTSSMVIRRRKDGSGYFIGCRGFPACKSVLWLPKHTVNISVVKDRVCNHCLPKPFHLVNIVLKTDTVSLGGNSEYTGCIGGCDPVFTEMLRQFNSPQICDLFFNNRSSSIKR